MTAASLLVSRVPRGAPTASVAPRGASRHLHRDARRVGTDAAAIHDGCSTKVDGSCASALGCLRRSWSAGPSASGDPAHARGSEAHPKRCPAHSGRCPAHSRGCPVYSSGIPTQTRRRRPRSSSLATPLRPSRGDSSRRVAYSERRRPQGPVVERGERGRVEREVSVRSGDLAGLQHLLGDDDARSRRLGGRLRLGPKVMADDLGELRDPLIDQRSTVDEDQRAAGSRSDEVDGSVREGLLERDADEPVGALGAV